MRALFRKASLWLILAPWGISTLGAASNQLVLFVNHDRFPVAMNIAKLNKWVPADSRVISNDGIVMIDETHCLMTSKTHLNILADIFDFHESIESIGDLLIDFGGSIAIFCYSMWFAWVLFKVIPKISEA